MAMLYQGDHGDMNVINIEKFPFYHNSSLDFLVSSAEDADDVWHMGEGEDDGEKGKKSRERNREHAKKTRLRKKVLLEGMKGKLVQLQSEASKLQQAFEERKTANILLAFSKPVSDQKDEGTLTRPATSDDFTALHDFSSLKGNIIENLRTRVRSEAAQKNLHANMLRQQRPSSDGIPPTLPPPPPPTSSSSFDIDMTVTSITDVDLDSDNENDDLESYQPLPKSFVNWKNGTVVSEDGLVRRLADDEMEHLRKERNRIHAKLTRDRKKLFTSRMQQMISSLERQNVMMRDHLLSLAAAAAPMLSFPEGKPPTVSAATAVPAHLRPVPVVGSKDPALAYPLGALFVCVSKAPEKAPSAPSATPTPPSTPTTVTITIPNTSRTTTEREDRIDGLCEGKNKVESQGLEHVDDSGQLSYVYPATATSL